MRKVLIATALGLITVLGGALPAAGKGPTTATFEAAGIDPITVGMSTGGDTAADDAYWKLVEQSAYWLTMDSGLKGDRQPITRPTGDLGPELRLAWDQPQAGDGFDRPAGQVHVLYPWAEGGPVTFVAAGQRTFTDSVTEDAWYKLHPDLPQTLHKLEVPGRARLTEAARVRSSSVRDRAGSTTSAGAFPAADAGPAVWQLVTGVAVLVVGVSLLRVSLKRRRSRPDPPEPSAAAA